MGPNAIPIECLYVIDIYKKFHHSISGLTFVIEPKLFVLFSVKVTLTQTRLVPNGIPSKVCMLPENSPYSS